MSGEGENGLTPFFVTEMAMPRIIAGDFRGRRIRSPHGMAVRPTAGRVKEALFQMLTPSLEGASVLDLYAGSGSLGLEALSRGARCCCFVEHSAPFCGLIRTSVEQVGCGARARIMRTDSARAVALLAREGARFDLVLADPPYAKSRPERSEFKKILRVLDRYDIFTRHALIVVEHFKRDCPVLDLMRLRMTRSRRYGDTVLSFFEMQEKTAVSPDSTLGW
jgi:16S rRNA (guanine(966)-N(2))-methyltransferase RsmD